MSFGRLKKALNRSLQLILRGVTQIDLGSWNGHLKRLRWRCRRVWKLEAELVAQG